MYMLYITLNIYTYYILYKQHMYYIYNVHIYTREYVVSRYCTFAPPL